MQKKLMALTAATYMGTFMATLDISIVNVALPSIQKSMGVSIAGMQWIIDSYAVCLAAFILAAGGLGAKFGLKRMWLFGIAGFTLSSLLCSLADGLPLLLIGRGLQGVAGAIIIPGALSIIFHSFKEDRLRARVVGGWSACTAVSLILGPSLGGFLVEHVGWPSIFIINIPIGAVALLLGAWGMKEVVEQAEAPLNLSGQVLSILGISGLIYSLIEAGGPEGLASLKVVGFFIASLILLVIFILRDTKEKHPLIPFVLFKSRSFALGNTASFILGFSYYSSLFFFSLFFQQAQGLAASQAGVRMVPIFALTALASLFFGRINTRIATRTLMITAYAMIGTAMILLGLVSPVTPFVVIGLLLALLGTGAGLAVPATSISVLSHADRQHFASASSVMNSLRQAGMAFGVAILGSLMSVAGVAHAAGQFRLGGAEQAEAMARKLVLEHQITGETALAVYREAMAYGFHWAVWVAGASSLAIALVVFLHKNRSEVS